MYRRSTDSLTHRCKNVLRFFFILSTKRVLDAFLFCLRFRETEYTLFDHVLCNFKQENELLIHAKIYPVFALLGVLALIKQQLLNFS